MTTVVEKFRDFRSRLEAVPIEQVEHGLLVVRAEAKHQYLEAFDSDSTKRRDPRDCIRAAHSLGLVVMAKFCFENGTPKDSFYHGPEWISDARTAVQELINDAPEDRKHLGYTLYFTQDIDTQRAIDEVVSASVNPGGPYSNHALAAGVATRQVVSVPYFDRTKT